MSKVESGANLALTRERAGFLPQGKHQLPTKGAREGDFRGIKSNSSRFPPSPRFSPRLMRDICVSGATQISTYLQRGRGVKRGSKGKKGRGESWKPRKGKPDRAPEGATLNQAAQYAPRNNLIKHLVSRRT